MVARHFAFSVRDWRRRPSSRIGHPMSACCMGVCTSGRCGFSQSFIWQPANERTRSRRPGNLYNWIHSMKPAIVWFFAPIRRVETHRRLRMRIAHAARSSGVNSVLNRPTRRRGFTARWSTRGQHTSRPALRLQPSFLHRPHRAAWPTPSSVKAYLWSSFRGPSVTSKSRGKNHDCNVS